MKKTVLFLLASIAIFPSLVFAETKPLAKPNVAVGIFPNHIDNVDLRSGTFNLDFTVWFRWDDPKIHPDKTFKLRNCKSDSQRVSWAGVIPHTHTKLAVIDVNASCRSNFDFSNFPFDAQKLTLQIEENEDEVDVVLYQADTENMSKTATPDVPAWKVSHINWSDVKYKYDTNYGNTEVKEDKSYTSTGFEYNVGIKHASRYSGFKLLLTPIILLILLNAGKLLKVTHGSRISLGTSALFASVATHYVITGQVPDSDSFSLAEQVVVLTILASGWYTLMTFFTLNKHESVDENQANTHSHLFSHKHLDYLNYGVLAAISLWVLWIILRAAFYV